MKKLLLATAMIGVMVFGLTPRVGALAATPADAGNTPDYSQDESWLQFPRITKDVDTFYIYSTAYIESSFVEGAPDYAPLDNLEMMAGAVANT